MSFMNIWKNSMINFGVQNILYWKEVCFMQTYNARFRNFDNAAQPVEKHLLRVGNLMSENAKNIGLFSTAKLIGILHDLGKISQDFQNYLCKNSAHSLKEKLDHSTAGGQFVLENAVSDSDFSLMLTQIVAHIIFSHHSGLLNLYGSDGSSDFLRRTEKENILGKIDFAYFFKKVISQNELKELLKTEEIANLDDKILHASKCDCLELNESYYFYWGCIQKMLLSLLVDFDRLDSAEFESNSLIAEETPLSWTSLIDLLETHLLKLENTNISSEKIRHLRHQICENCLSSSKNPVGVYQLSAPTGGGKTLASMRFAIHHAKIYNKKRIILILPYMSIIDQAAETFRQVFGENIIYEHHSDIIPLTKKHKNVIARWDASIIVTTQVQFLNSFFDGKNSSLRRLHALTDSVLIFDEVQTIPFRCTHLFNSAINFLAKFCHTTSLLCTATQPPLDRLGCPIELAPCSQIVKITNQENEFKRVHLESECVVGGQSAEEFACNFQHGFKKFTSALCIVNLTRQAREIYQLFLERLGEDIHVIHLSSKMCPAHRKNVLDSIKTYQAKKERMVCVSTSLVECGVDFSFPLVYRAITSLSSIVQSAGRCNRNGEQDSGVVRLFNLANENLFPLPEINRGKNLLQELLFSLQDTDLLLSENIMQKYYDQYYCRFSQKELRFPLKKENGTIYDLLSSNNLGYMMREERGDSLDLFFPQAFSDAGKEFSVIDSVTQPVLVPYQEGISLIEEWDSREMTAREIYEMLRKSQNFCVNLFEREYKTLQKNGAIFITKNGIPALKESFYDEAGILFLKG